MKTYFSLDTEDDSKGNVFCLNFYNGLEHFTFYNQHDALAWLCEQKGCLEVWCVNLGYDLNNLFSGFLDRLEITYVDSRIISARIVKVQVYFRDTLNHWKISVAEMGQRIGLPKLKVRNRKNIEYCKRDTEITFRFVMEMKAQYEKIGCNLKATIGSTALEYYYSKYSTRPTDEEIIPQNEIEFIKRGYYGGRTEIFHTQPVTGNIQYFDVNSLYPSVMRDYEFPELSNRYWTNTPDFSKEGMAHVELQFNNFGQTPYLPSRSDKGLLFPIGRIEGIYSYFEIRKALDLGYSITKRFKALEFSKRVRPFISFVETLYQMRLDAKENKDELLSDSAKLISNNLYGKFGQGNEYSKLVPLKNPKKQEGVIYGNLILKSIKGKYPPHANGIWACYVTAYARHRLYEGLMCVVSGGGLLMYCDTDSIIFESDRKLIEPSDKLGEFKLEGEFRYGHFKLPKLYCLIPKRGKWIYRAKGVPRKQASNFFKYGKAEFRRPYKLRETLRRNLSPKRQHVLVPNYWEVTKKEVRRTYDKRIVFKDGSTKPITL